jgi:nitrogen fixation protein FixH
MRFNWGTGIVVAMIVFMSFIVTLVVIMSGSGDGLEESGYYEKGNRHDEKLEAMQNAANLGAVLEIKWLPAARAVSIDFGTGNAPDSGIVLLKRPSDLRLDFNQSLRPGTDSQVVAWEGRQSGLWNVECSWHQQGKRYFKAHQLLIP